MECRMRIGHGYDVHRLVSDRPLILGGVNIPHAQGLLGHSDADVLLHAIMDSILGAMAMGDIGQHFPDTSDAYKGISSLELLGRVKKLMDENGYKIVNIDSTILAQRPKLAPYIGEMRAEIAKVLDSHVQNIHVKATTEEGLGFSGREEGIAAHAVCLLYKKISTEQ